MYIYIYIYITYTYIYIYIYNLCPLALEGLAGAGRQRRQVGADHGGLARDDTVGNPSSSSSFVDSSFSSSSFSVRVVRACPLTEITETSQAAACRAIQGSFMSVGSTLPPLKDDLVAIHDGFDAELVAILGRLPVGWHLCYLGFHLPPGSSTS